VLLNYLGFLANATENEQIASRSGTTCSLCYECLIEYSASYTLTFCFVIGVQELFVRHGSAIELPYHKHKLTITDSL